VKAAKALGIDVPATLLETATAATYGSTSRAEVYCIQQPRRTAGSGKYFVQACSPKNPATKMTTTTTPMM
jgi:hypothetical protein